MAKLVGYAMMSANKNAIGDGGHLVKAMCGFCGRKFGSKHLNDLIRKDLNEQFKESIMRSKA